MQTLAFRRRYVSVVHPCPLKFAGHLRTLFAGD